MNRRRFFFTGLSGIALALTAGEKQATAASARRQPVSVREVGAAGDGAIDDTAALQGVLDSVGSAGGGAVFVPAGVYKHQGLRLPPNITLFGEGPSSVLQNVGSGVSISAMGQPKNYYQGSYLHNIKLLGSATTSHGVLIANATRDITLQRVYVHGHGGDGIRCESTIGALIDDCDLRRNAGIGVVLTESPQVKYCSGNLIRACHITSNAGSGIALVAKSSGGAVFSNTLEHCVIEGNNTPGKSGAGVVVDGAWVTRILYNTFEAAIDANIMLANRSGYIPGGTLIIGNKFSNSGAPVQHFDIDIQSGMDTVIEHNSFPRSGGNKQPRASVREGPNTRTHFSGLNQNLVRASGSK